MDNYGFNYRGKHSYNDFGIIVTDVSRPLMPPIQTRQVTIPGRDGIYLFGSRYDARPIQVSIQLAYSALADLASAKRNLSAWLSPVDGAGQLVFDDETDKYYNAVLSVDTPISQILAVGTGTLSFLCPDPYAYLIDTAAQALTFDSSITWDNTLSWDDQFTFTVTGITTVNVNNFGTVKVAPVITVTGTFDTLSLSVNGKTFNYNEALASGTLSIDNDKWNVTLDGANKNDKWSGDMIVLVVGYNSVQIGGTNLNCTVDFGALRPEFL